MKYFRILAMLLFAAILTFSACGGGGSDNTIADGSGTDVTDDGATDGDAIVTIAAIPGVTPPAYGQMPVTTITETAQYTGTVSWSPVDNPFDYETEYTATITLTAKSGYTLTGVEANFFTIVGADTVTHDEDSGVVIAVFPATGETLPQVIDIAPVPGVTAPAAGETPVTAITETAQYTGTVSWSPVDNPFDYETEYTATITLTAKSGYTVTGVGANFFTVAGADTVTHDVDTGVVTAVFSATEAVPPTVIDIAAIPGVTVPVVGETPVTTITETAQYTGTVSWSPSDATFESKAYTATITLTAKSGYTLTGVAANFFTVAGTSAAATNSVDSGVVTAIFPQADWSTTYNLRDTGPAGGLIFYINPNAATDGWKYLEAWTADESGTYKWKTSNTTTTGTLTAIGTGKANTGYEIEGTTTGMIGDDHPAAKVVREASHGGFNDWFLPSKDELAEMYTNLKGAGAGVGGFADNYYWSSSEDSGSTALGQLFFNGAQGGNGKDSTYRVRAVRAF